MHAKLRKQSYESLDEKTLQKISKEQGFSFAFANKKIIGIIPASSTPTVELAEEERGR